MGFLKVLLTLTKNIDNNKICQFQGPKMKLPCKLEPFGFSFCYIQTNILHSIISSLAFLLMAKKYRSIFLIYLFWPK